MNLAYLSVLIAALMPLVLAGLAKFGGVRHGVAYDNAAPRESLARLAGWPQRANWAQQNSWEAFALFSVSMLMALQSGFDPAKAGVWGVCFIAVRLAYSALYLLDMASARSLCWLLGLAICLRLMGAAL